MDLRELNRSLLARTATAHGYDARTALAMVAEPRRILSAQAPVPAATHSITRTNTSFFPWDSKREMRAEDWKEVVKKSRYLRNATGIVRGLFEKPVKFVCPGGLTPSAATPDETYNEAADDYFDRWASAPIDVSGEYDFWGSIEMLATEMPCDGGIFGLKVRGWTNRCQLQFLKCDQIGDAFGAKDDPKRKFQNGILRNSVGRPLAYRVLQEPLRRGEPAFRDYSAEDMLHIYDSTRLNCFGRPLPWIYHGANPALDVLDMRALDQVARKLNLMLAAVIKRVGAKGAGLGAKLTGAELAALVGAASGDTIAPASTAAATTDTGPVTWEMILGGGAVPVLRDGEELDTIDTDRSPTSWIEASEFLIREIAAGYGTGFEFVWNMAALGGPTSRLLLEDLNAFCEKFRRILIGRYCQSVRSWVIANAIIHGELAEPTSGNWWDCVWTGPKNVTIDRGREGALFVRLLEKGMITLDEWWSFFGKDSRRMRRKRIREIKEDLLECERQGVPYSLYCSAAPGTSPSSIIPISEIATPGTPAAEALARLLDHKDASVTESVRALFGAEFLARLAA